MMAISNKQLSEVLDALIEKGVYYTWITCGNCGFEEFVFIPKSTTISQWTSVRACPNCNCAMDGGE